MQATVFLAGRGFWLAVCDGTDETVFIHYNEVANNRYLRENDRVEFDAVPNPRKPGKLMGVRVRYLGHVIARQISHPAVQS